MSEKGKLDIDPIAWVCKHEIEGVCVIGREVFEELLKSPNFFPHYLCSNKPPLITGKLFAGVVLGIKVYYEGPMK